MSDSLGLITEGEDELLLPRNTDSSPASLLRTRGWRKASPSWLIPIVLIVSMARGMSLAPRIQVYTEIACRAVNGPSDGNSSLSLLPELLKDCSSSAVQARASKIQAMVATIMAVLSAVTTGPWSQFGDANGRKIVLSISIFGAMSDDIIYILVTRPGSIFFRYAEQIIAVGPFIEGFVGGISTFNGAVHA